MIGFALSLFGVLADAFDAKSRGCRGRLMILFVGLAVSTVAMVLHWVPSFAVHESIGDFTTGSNSSEAPTTSTVLLIYHLIVRCIFATGISATYPVLNGLTLARLELDGRDANEYGKERLWGAVSWGVTNSIFGIAIDTWGFGILYITTILSFVGCTVTFYFYAKADDSILVSADVIKAQRDLSTSDGNQLQSSDAPHELVHRKTNDSEQFNEDKKFSDEDQVYDTTTSTNTPHDSNQTEEMTTKQFTISFLLRTLSTQPNPLLNISYIIAIFTLYIGVSVVENLIFLYFEFLGGSNALCGLTVAVTVLFELPIFHYASDILHWIKSPVWLFQWGCLAYVVRVIGYSIIPQSHAPWVLVLEPLHGFTIGFVLTGSVAFIDNLMPKGYESSGQGFLSSVMGLGQFIGLCIGGVLEGRVLYRVLAGIVSLGSIILAIGHHVSTKATIEERGSTPELELQQPKRRVVKRKCSDFTTQRLKYDQVAHPDEIENPKREL